MAAAKQAGALSALKVKPIYGEAIDEDDDVDEAMRRVMDAYTARQQRNYDPYLMAIGQGLLASRGNFGEAVGMAAKSYEDVRAKLGQEEIDTSAANLQLAQSRRDQALLRRKTEAGAGLFGGTSGAGKADNYGDQDAVSFLVANGMPRKEAVALLVQEGIRPTQRLSDTGVDMGDMERYAKYVTTYGNDDTAKGFMEMMKLKNQQYTYQNGVRVNNLTGEAEFVQPKGLPAAGAKDIDLFMGTGTYKVDARTAKLYEFANNQGPEVAKKFAETYLKTGVVPKDIVDKYNEQQSGAKAPSGGEMVDEQQLKNAFTGLQLKSPSLFSAVSTESGERTPLQPLPKGTKLSPIEAEVIGSMFRLKNAKSEKDVSPFDLQVLNFLKANATKGIPLEGGAAEPAAAIKVSAAAPPAPPPPAAAAPAAAAAPVPVVKAAAPAAVVPVAKAAEAPAKAAAVTSAPPSAAASAGLKPPAPPRIINVPPLKANASLEEKQSQDALKANAEAANSAERERFRIESEQYAKEINRPKDVDAAIEEAVQKKRGELAEVDEQTFVKALDTSRQIKSASLRVMKNVIQNPNAIGMLADPGLFNAVASLVSDGFSAGNTTVKLADAEGALAKAMPGITAQDLQSRSEIAKDLAEIELLYRREFLAGLGTVTDSEGRVVQRLGGTPSDSPTVLIRRMELITSKAKYKEDKVKAFRKWRANKNNKSLSINDWLASDEAIRMDENYDKTTDALYDKFFGAPATKTSEGAAVVPQLKNAKQALSDLLKGK
jgi:hypothetical protein